MLAGRADKELPNSQKMGGAGKREWCVGYRPQKGSRQKAESSGSTKKKKKERTTLSTAPVNTRQHGGGEKAPSGRTQQLPPLVGETLGTSDVNRDDWGEKTKGTGCGECFFKKARKLQGDRAKRPNRTRLPTRKNHSERGRGNTWLPQKRHCLTTKRSQTTRRPPARLGRGHPEKENHSLNCKGNERKPR